MTHSLSPQASHNTVRNRILTCLAAVAAACLALAVYWPGTHGGFLLDDFPNIVANTPLHLKHLSTASLLAAVFSSPSSLLGRPLSMLTFALNIYLGGMAPYGMKLTNILIHCLNGLLVCLFLTLLLEAYRRQFRPDLTSASLRLTAIAVTVAWLLLPINLTAVLYIVQRMTSLSGTFVLVGLVLYIWGRLRMNEGRSGLPLLWLGIVAMGTLAILAKESGALLPVYALIIEWVLFRFARPDGSRDRRLVLLFLLTLVLPGILGLILVAPSSVVPNSYANRPFTLGQRLLTEPRVLFNYIIWTLVPNLRSLSLYHDDYPLSHSLLNPLTTLLSIVALVLLLATAVKLRRRNPLFSLGILWFFGGQLLTATVFNLELVYEHRNYLPSLGLLLALFSILLLEPSRQTYRLPRYAVAVTIILLYTTVTSMRVQEWSNPLRHAAIAAAEHPASPRATYALGRMYAVLADNTDPHLLGMAQTTLGKAAAVPHSDILPEQALLMTNAQHHLPLDPAWWASIDRKLKRPISAQGTQALYSLVHCQVEGQCAFPQGPMLRLFEIARKVNPHTPDVLAIYSNYVLNVLHRPQTARELMVDTIQMAPRQQQYRVNLIKLDIALGRFSDADKEIEALRALNHLGRLDMVIEEMQRRLHGARTAAATPASPVAAPASLDQTSRSPRTQ